MNIQSIAFAAVAGVALAGCYASNVRVGNAVEYTSIADQREASRTVQVLKLVPAGAQVVGIVEAGRCHRSFMEKAPAEETVILDLKIAAFAKGADAIVIEKIGKQSALTRNCWYMYDGRATALRLPAAQGLDYGTHD